MSAKLLGTTALLALSGTLALGGCSGSTTAIDSTPATAIDSTPATSETTLSGANDQGCNLAEATGKSKNEELMALATAQYEALDCAGDLAGQLKTLGKDQDLQKKVEAAGWNLTTGEAAGGVTLSIVDVTDRTSCIVTVMNSPKAKTLNCGDV